jgi:peptide/nickel transport system substrate-binding protein
MEGVAVRNPGPIPVNLWGHPPDVKGYTFNLDRAREHLARARTKVTRPLEVLSIGGVEISDQAALLLQSSLKKLGIDLKIRQVSFPQLVASAKSAETAADLSIHWVSPYYPDPDNWIGQMYDSKGWGTWKALSYYKNEEMDRLLSEARKETSQQKREALYQQATRKALDEAIDVYIYNTLLQRGLSKRLRGYQFCPVGDGLEFWPLYFA